MPPLILISRLVPVTLQPPVEPFQPPAQVTFVFDEANDRAQAEAWLRTTFGLTETGDLSQLDDTLATDARLVRGTELWSVGAFDEAQREISALLEEKRNAGDALASYQLAIYLRDKGALYWSIVAAADVLNAAQVSTLDAPAYIARMRYPAYFPRTDYIRSTKLWLRPAFVAGAYPSRKPIQYSGSEHRQRQRLNTSYSQHRTIHC
jgi:hypothetical protein